MDNRLSVLLVDDDRLVQTVHRYASKIPQLRRFRRKRWFSGTGNATEKL
jgi:hypothetical protein